MNRHLLFSLIVAGALTAGLVLGANASGRTLLASPVAGLTGAASGADTSPAPKAKPSHSPEPAESPEPADRPEPNDGDSGSGGGGQHGGHPCNHGFYVSQAAHAHKGGSYVSSVAHSDLGKNGDCSAPLPKP